MIRLLVIALILSLGVKLIFGRWPWEYLRGRSTRDKAIDRARQLLGVAPGANRPQIMEAHKRLVAMVHPDRGDFYVRGSGLGPGVCTGGLSAG